MAQWNDALIFGSEESKWRVQKHGEGTELLHGHFTSLPDGGVDRTGVICNQCEV